MEQIQVIGARELDDMEIDAINRLTNKYYPKIRRELKNDVSLVIHVKKYKKYDHVKEYGKYSIHIRAIAPMRIFVSTKGFDWRINAALHKAFKDIINEIRHSLHTDEQHKYAPKELKELIY